MLQFLAISLQIVGTVVTGFGLGDAYSRAKYEVGLVSRLRRSTTKIGTRLGHWWAKVLGKSVDVRKGSATGGFTFKQGTVRGAAPPLFVLNNDLLVDGRLEQLADKIREHDTMFRAIASYTGRLEATNSELRTFVTQSDAKVLDESKGEVRALRSMLASEQMRDLVLALCGLTITFVGTLLSYFA